MILVYPCKANKATVFAASDKFHAFKRKLSFLGELIKNA